MDTKQMKHTCYRARDKHRMSIHRDQEGDLWVEATWAHTGAKGLIVEHLFCLDEFEGVFILLSRTIQKDVSITDAARRHAQFPINCKVRLGV